MRLIAHVLERVALVVLLVGGVGILAAMFLGTADVIGTQLLHAPVPGATELTESTMVLVVFGALTYAQIRRKHIRVELLHARCGPRGKAAMDILADVTGLVFYGLLAWQAYNEALYSIQIDEATFGLIRFPLWPARIIVVVGVWLLMLRLLLDVIEDTKRMIEGRELEPSEDELLAGLPEFRSEQ